MFQINKYTQGFFDGKRRYNVPTPFFPSKKTYTIGNVYRIYSENCGALAFPPDNGKITTNSLIEDLRTPLNGHKGDGH